MTDTLTLFGGTFARGGVDAEIGDAAWLRAMLDAEAALAEAEGRLGLITAGVAREIADACRTAVLDVAEIGRAAADGGTPVIPLVAALRAAVGPAAAPWVHHGATSQDILDTAAMLVVRRAAVPLSDDLTAAADAAARLAAEHRDTPMAGRTLMQQALPITFGWEAAGWMAALDAAASAIDDMAAHSLAAQLGGPVGTLVDFGAAGPRLVEAFADILGLPAPTGTWHTERSRIGRVAAALAISAGACAKVSGDIVLLAQTEVGEVREGVPGRGGSSSMAHKRNAIAAISALGCAQQAPGLAANLFAAAQQEHQRAAGRWHSEWLSALLQVTGSAAAWTRDSVEHLEIDAERMRGNLALGAEPDGGTARYVDAAAVAVDRALDVHASRSRKPAMA